METFTGVAVDELAVQEALQMGEGEIDFETFVNIFGVDTGSSDTAFDDRVEIAFRAFQQIDAEGNGSIGPADLNRGLQLMGIDVGIEEMQRMFDEVDDDGSGAPACCKVSCSLQQPTFISLNRRILAAFLLCYAALKDRCLPVHGCHRLLFSPPLAFPAFDPCMSGLGRRRQCRISLTMPSSQA